MKVQTYDGADSQAILTAMIVNDRALARISSRWETGGLFASRPENILANFCVKYHATTGKAPGSEIETIFRSWAEGHEREKDAVEFIGRLIEGLSEQYKARAEVINPEYATVLAAKHFNRVRELKLSDEIKIAHEMGRPERASELIQSHRRVELGPESDVDLVNDQSIWETAMSVPNDSIIKYRGAAGKFFGRALGHGNFVSLMGPPKRGKTWVLLDLAWEATLQRRRTVFLEVGDMTQNQIVRRFMTRAANRPLWAKSIKYPTSVRMDRHSKVSVEFDTIPFDESLSVTDAKKGFEKAVKKHIKSKEPYLKLRCYPAGTVSVSQISAMVDDWCQHDWVPDVVVIDYADLLVAPSSRDDFRHKVNAVWEGLRKLSTAGCQPLVITATQANRESFDANTVTMKHASEDMRKLAHVTGVIGLSSTNEEKALGVLRLNWSPLREDEFNSHRCVAWAGCLSVGKPCVLSCFKDDDTEKEEPSAGTNNGHRSNGHAVAS